MRLLVDLLAARARRAGVRWLLVSVAVALATLPLVVGPAVGATTAAAALRRGVAALPAGDRGLTVSYGGIPDATLLARIDTTALDALGGLGSGRVRRQVLFNALSDRSGGTFRLAGTDDLAGVTRVVAGRRPASCRPGRCEVALLEPASGPASGPVSDAASRSASALPDLDPALGLVVVGRLERIDPLLLGGTFDPGVAAPVLLAGPDLATAVPERLAAFGRAYGWVSRWDADRAVALGVDGWLGLATRAGVALSRVASGVVLTAPDDVVRREAFRAELSARRLGLLAAGSCVALLGAAVVGGTALRRDHEAFTTALRSRGASGRLVAALLAGEGLLAAATGVVAGLASGAVVAAVLAARGGLPVAAATAAAVVAAVPASAVLAALATGLLVAAVALPAPVPGRRAGLSRTLEGAALACLGAAALVAAGGGIAVPGLPGAGGGIESAVGSADAGGAASAAGAGGPLLTVLPVLLLAGAALVVARIWPALAGAMLRLPPRRALGARLGLAAVAGRPGRPAATAAVLAAAVAGAVFAAGYAATLDRGAAEQAAQAVPLDARLTPGPGLVAPPEEVPPDRLAAALPGATVTGVVRTAGSVRIGPQQADVVQFVGLDPSVLPRIGRWEAVAGSGTDPSALARQLRAGPMPAPRGLPSGRVLRIETPGDPVRVAVTAYVRAADGRERGVPLAVDAAPSAAARTAPAASSSASSAASSGTAALVGRLPDLTDATGAPAHLDLVALAVRQPSDEADRRLHAISEGTADQAAPSGTLGLGAVSVDGTVVPTPWRGWTSSSPIATLAAADGGARARLVYRLTAASAIAVPAAVAGPVPVVVDRRTAASSGGVGGGGGRLTLLVDGVAFEAAPVAVLDGFPTVQGRFAVLDAGVLADLVERTRPGGATPSELWVSAGPGGEAALARPAAATPLDRLAVRLRGQEEAALRDDPVARAATGLLLAGAALGLAVALAAVALLVAGERTDDAEVHYAWEADGVAPGTLRAALWWGAVAVVVPGVLAGAAAGFGLSALTARLVAVTASATVARPPLHAEPGDPWVLAATAASVLLTLAVAGAVAARSMREPLPVRRGGWFR